MTFEPGDKVEWTTQYARRGPDGKIRTFKGTVTSRSMTGPRVNVKKDDGKRACIRTSWLRLQK